MCVSVCVATHFSSTTARWISINFILNGSYQLCANDTFSDFRNFTFYHFYSKKMVNFQCVFQKTVDSLFLDSGSIDFDNFFLNRSYQHSLGSIFPIFEILLFTNFIVKMVNFQCVFSNFRFRISFSRQRLDGFFLKWKLTNIP